MQTCYNIKLTGSQDNIYQGIIVCVYRRPVRETGLKLYLHPEAILYKIIK